jgi:hypothetical protein
VTDEIERALQPLVGLPLWAVGRAGSLEWFQFGGPRTVPTLRGGTKEVGEFALHLDCPWRLVGPNGLAGSDESQRESLAVIGQPPLVCESASAVGNGGAAIRFAGGWLLNVYAGDPEALEFWRLFRPGADKSHFVVGPAGVEK